MFVRYKVGAFFLLVTSMFLAYRIQHSNLTWLELSISSVSLFLPILASGGVSHHSILSFPNHNPHLDSIGGETPELETEEPIINALPHLL